MIAAYSDRYGIQIATELANFIEERALPGTGVSADRFWSGLAAIIERFTPRNRALLAKRQEMQASIDAWHKANPGAAPASDSYISFLFEIGYLVAEPPPFSIDTDGVDPEISTIAGPQLVVPCLNARFALNAANARWGSLYDALYGTDAVAPPLRSNAYDPARGAKVVEVAKGFLDTIAPLTNQKWSEWKGGALNLQNPEHLVGQTSERILLRNNGLLIDVIVDRKNQIGRNDPAGISDIHLESALTTIVDLEDSIAAVDAEDKTLAYANWLALIRAELEASFEKDGKTIHRRMAEDKVFNGTTLSGRSLLLVRNVGHLMTTPAVLLADGIEAPEGVIDAVVTALCGMHDLKGLARLRNSRAGAIYIVKPKMHGPEEAAFSNDLFDATEDLLGLSRHTIKIGLMDEERRTSANLAATIHAIRHRIFFVNTGFLDRTGDEIRTSMYAGPMMRKADIKAATWIRAYEERNVSIALACGFSGKAQIGKGMWAMPDAMAEMVAQKIAHPQAGASTAWVPSPSAATLHAMHYHLVDVSARQAALEPRQTPALELLLQPPLQTAPYSDEEIQLELETNLQSILGYVVRWIDQGVGCSKVPDLSDVGLMEDRATLRISSQHVANWLCHGIVDAPRVEAALKKMAHKVDLQNSADPNYTPMAPHFDRSLAFQAARALVFQGADQPNGYTEPLLHTYRRQRKAAPSP